MDAIKIKIDLFKKLTEDFGQAAFRRAGLYGLSAVGVALYQRNVRLTQPILIEKNIISREFNISYCKCIQRH